MPSLSRRSRIIDKVMSSLVYAHTKLFYFIGKILFHVGRVPKDFETSKASTRVYRVVVIRLDEIGDVVLTSPLLRKLRSLFPDAFISLVVKPSSLDLVKHCPYVNEILLFDQSVPRWLKPLVLPLRAVSFASKFFSQPIDVAVMPRWGVDECYATFLCFFTRAKQRLSFSEHVSKRKRLLNRGFDEMMTVALEDMDVKHEVERGLRLAEVLGSKDETDYLEVWSDPQDSRFFCQIDKDYLLTTSKAIVVLGLGARHPKRIWPVERFIEVGRWLIDEHDARLCLIGSKGEESLGEIVTEQLGSGVINLIGRTTLGQVTELLRHVNLFVGNDSGSVHLAAAAGVPVVEVSCHPENGERLHPNSPDRFGPWGVKSAVVRPSRPLWQCIGSCVAEESHCITLVTVKDVVDSIKSLGVLKD